jgi:hypothetical protein
MNGAESLTRTLAAGSVQRTTWCSSTNICSQVRKQLKEVEWAKGIEWVKLARRDGQSFDCENREGTHTQETFSGYSYPSSSLA